MGLFSFLFGSQEVIEERQKEYGGVTGAIDIHVPANLVYKEMALYVATSYIANAISCCEFRTYVRNKNVKELDWYILNVAPNKNENASVFWNKIINKMIRNRVARAVEINGELFIIESCTCEKDELNGDTYSDIMLQDGTILNRIYKSREIYVFELESKELSLLINSMWNDYGAIMQSAARAFKDTNARRYRLKLDGIEAGDPDFAKDWNNYIKNQIETYMKNEYSTYVEYDGYELIREDAAQGKSADDLLKIKKDMFEMVAQTLKIPNTLMTGNVTSLKEVCNIFLTFGVDPYADAIGKALNKIAGAKQVIDGTYYRVHTGKVKHRDPIEDAPNIEKLIGSGALDIDETRDEIDYLPVGEWWSKIHWLTKNWSKIEDVANGMVKGGENSEGN